MMSKHQNRMMCLKLGRQNIKSELHV